MLPIPRPCFRPPAFLQRVMTMHYLLHLGGIWLAALVIQVPDDRRGRPLTASARIHPSGGGWASGERRPKTPRVMSGGLMNDFLPFKGARSRRLDKGAQAQRRTMARGVRVRAPVPRIMHTMRIQRLVAGEYGSPAGRERWRVCLWRVWCAYRD